MRDSFDSLSLIVRPCQTDEGIFIIIDTDLGAQVYVHLKAEGVEQLVDLLKSR